MNSKQAKQIPIENYLASGGIYPTKTSHNTLWYRSPVRNGDSTPSFKVTLNKNLWWDYGLNQGGNIIELVTEQFKTDVRDALKIIENSTANNIYMPKLDHIKEEARHKDKNTLVVLEESELTDTRLITYITKERKIDWEIAQKYLCQIKYENNGKVFTSIGFKNNKGGYEIRGKGFKGASSPKGITTINPQSEDTISVFEGVMDFLSFLTQYQLKDFQSTVIILNSLAFKASAIEWINSREYPKCYTFLDNDLEGRAGQRDFEEYLHTPNITDKAGIYEGFDDYNEYWTSQ